MKEQNRCPKCNGTRKAIYEVNPIHKVNVCHYCNGTGEQSEPNRQVNEKDLDLISKGYEKINKEHPSYPWNFRSYHRGWMDCTCHCERNNELILPDSGIKPGQKESAKEQFLSELNRVNNLTIENTCSTASVESYPEQSVENEIREAFENKYPDVVYGLKYDRDTSSYVCQIRSDRNHERATTANRMWYASKSGYLSHKTKYEEEVKRLERIMDKSITELQNQRSNRDEEITSLKQQIEAMKCCGNCGNAHIEWRYKDIMSPKCRNCIIRFQYLKNIGGTDNWTPKENKNG